LKHFAILRTVPDNLTWDQFDAAAIQNLLNLHVMGDPRNIEWTALVPDVAWVRSYWEPGSTWGTCLYAAPDEPTVRQWHDVCKVEYAAIREVEVEEAAGASDEYSRGYHAPRDGEPLIVVETPGGVDMTPGAGARWIRTYRDTEGGRELRLYAREDGGDGFSTIAARRVVEVRPADYA